MREGSTRFFPPLGDQPGPVLGVAELSEGIGRYFSWMSGGGKDEAVHSGLAGVALTALFVAELEDDGEQWRTTAALANKLGKREPKHFTFANGVAGVWVVVGAATDSVEKQSRLTDQLCELAAAVVKEKVPNELWYGRSGVLSSLLFAEDHFDAAACKERLHDAQLLLWDRIVEDADWTWHQTRYVGLVHGYAGIVLLLHRALARFSEREQAKRKSGTIRMQEVAEMVRGLQLPSGNFPSSLNERRNDRDELVQLCHGAPGVALMLLEFGWIDEAKRAGECIWQRGLLRKGVGLCHGIGGNGLVLLHLYQATGEEIWLTRGSVFARFAMRHCTVKQSALVVEPDDPWGLVNGIGGLVCLLAALKHVLSHPREAQRRIHVPFL